jgi:hypothetical protein
LNNTLSAGAGRLTEGDKNRYKEYPERGKRREAMAISFFSSPNILN